MHNIKVIPTRYKGYHFRSRLEARWAVAFDAIKLEWEYEKEGFNFDGVCYLPDFWFPQVNMWGEVKPGKFSPEDCHKCHLLAKATGHEVLMLDGMPDSHTYYGMPSCGMPCACFNHYDIWRDTHIDEKRFYTMWGEQGGAVYPETVESLGELADVAMKAARSARFEFGQSGN